VPAKPSSIEILPTPLSATKGIETPFGHRWGGDVFRLSLEHLSAMQTGQTLALDVMSEYITFLQLSPEATANLSTSSQA
jgi:hypothetical protein